VVDFLALMGIPMLDLSPEEKLCRDDFRWRKCKVMTPKRDSLTQTLDIRDGQLFHHQDFASGTGKRNKSVKLSDAWK
jgi:hypothetical protein